MHHVIMLSIHIDGLCLALIFHHRRRSCGSDRRCHVLRHLSDGLSSHNLLTKALLHLLMLLLRSILMLVLLWLLRGILLLMLLISTQPRSVVLLLGLAVAALTVHRYGFV